MRTNISSDSNLPALAAGNDALPAQASPHTASWNSLPPELQHMAASHLQGRDQLHFALASKKYFAMLQPELQRMRLSARIKNTVDFSAFRALLHPGPATIAADDAAGAAAETIHDASPATRDEMLAALASRIVALPLHQHGPATALWRATAQPLAGQNLMLRTELQQQDKSARLCDQVEQMDTITDVRSLLGTSFDTHAQDTIGSLQPHLQVKPLMALASRIVLLPFPEQQPAMALFAAAAAALPEDAYAHLTGLEEEAHRAGDAGALHEIACFSSVKSGESVADVVRRSGAVDGSLITTLRYTAWGTAVKNGTPPDEAAAALGMTDPHQINEARYFVASEDMDHGETAAVVIARYRITDPTDVDDLMDTAMNRASIDIQNGMPAAEAAAAHGITGDDNLGQLSHVALDAALTLIPNGVSAQDAAARFHITGAAHLAELSRTAVQAAVTTMLRAGVSVQAAAAAYGITAPDQLAELARAGINAARVDMHHGFSLPEAAERRGIVAPGDLAQLRLEATLDTAANEIQAGSAPHDVIARYGITDPEHVVILSSLRPVDTGQSAPSDSGSLSPRREEGR